MPTEAHCPPSKHVGPPTAATRNHQLADVKREDRGWPPPPDVVNADSGQSRGNARRRLGRTYDDAHDEGIG